ncbi:MAG: sulfatase-like hydrolase/transferase [Bacteroidales bacterium]|nr:sulfatase-like hydrolase/transferase [Bacteroidales bacterium]MDD3890905.1 sulfatase-like hydrolase/transferase [Bacteroidales bacterium]
MNRKGMNRNRYKLALENYAKAIFSIYSLVLIFRLIESVLIFYNYGFSKKILCSELIGLGYDFLGVSLPIVIYFLLYSLVSKAKGQTLQIVHVGILFITVLVFLPIIQYFLYQLEPLDVFLYKHPIDEVLFTIKTSGLNLFSIFIFLIATLSLTALIVWMLNKVKLGPSTIKVTYTIVLISLPLFFAVHSLRQNKLDKFSVNKPAYFISKTMKYMLQADTEYQTISINDFQKLYPDKTFIDEEYPLVYKKDRSNELGEFFNEFEVSPNIVILIVEGLSDDFIHEYKGAVLMPFLNELKDKSLYWNHCFTLGERSFAVVPCILGGLPYGDKGFTLQERLPRHLSLVSILNSNDYYTSFFYGQGAWFHQKGRFFKYNDIDLIFDNKKFSEDFDKIIVGKNNFFWGYNDKDLFNQSLRTIDTLAQTKRLDVYFTGTSHAPFVISDEDYYTNKLEDYAKYEYQDFYNTYAKYLKTILFVDDALEDFFNEYKKRQNYENTIFIITGDHPMTEVPIENSLKRYHVPLIIFSEKLKGNKTFSNFASHHDIPETILSTLQDYMPYNPALSTSLGTQLLSQSVKQTKSMAFMNTNREVVDFLWGDYYLSEEKLYKVDSTLSIEEVMNDSIKNEITSKLSAFRSTSLYVCRNNKIISSDMYCEALNLQKIYAYQNTDVLETSSEYFSIIEKTKMPNKDMTFDISLNIKTRGDTDASIVYQIINLRDSTLLWKNFGFTNDKITQAHIQIDQIPSVDSILYFKSYIWNKQRSNLTVSDIDVLLRTSKPINHNNAN